MTKIGVVGSINTDFVFKSKNLPLPSETILGDSFDISFGGKGANEAVALARLGADCCLFGAIGKDIFSKENLKNLKKEKVCVKNIKICENVSGGAAGITVGSGTNSIVVVPGANQEVTIDYLKSVEKELLECDIIGTQLEIPLKSVEYLIKLAKKNHKTLVFNPSPIVPLPQKLLDDCSYIIVNEVEIKRLPGYQNDDQLLQRYNGKLILTRGKEGAFFWDITYKSVKNIPSLKVKTVDTTGAGDTFLASFMYALSKKQPLCQALTFANTCAGLKVTKSGAQTGMPTIKEVKAYTTKK